MAQIVEYESAHGLIRIEVGGTTSPPIGPRKAGISEGANAYVSKAATSFEDALSNAFSVANAFVKNAAALSVSPNELSIEFGLKLSSDVHLFVISGNGEANFAIKMKWAANDANRAKQGPG